MVEGVHLHITCHNYKSPICLRLSIKYPVIYCCGFDRNSKPNQNQESCIRLSIETIYQSYFSPFPRNFLYHDVTLLFDICEP